GSTGHRWRRPRSGHVSARGDAGESPSMRTMAAPSARPRRRSTHSPMKTQYYTATSLHGFIADAHNSLDWLLQFSMTDDYPAFIRDVGAVAMGSTTYEWILADLARSGADQPWPYEQPVWVFTSRSLPSVPGADVRFVRGDVRPVHEQMVAAAGGKNVWLVGGGELVGQFHDHGLVDELIV